MPLETSLMKTYLLSGDQLLNGNDKLSDLDTVFVNISPKEVVMVYFIDSLSIFSCIVRLSFPSGDSNVVSGAAKTLGILGKVTSGIVTLTLLFLLRPRPIITIPVAMVIKNKNINGSLNFISLYRCLSVNSYFCSLILLTGAGSVSICKRIYPVIELFRVHCAHIYAAVAHGVSEIVMPVSSVKTKASALTYITSSKEHYKGYIWKVIIISTAAS